MAGNGSGTSGLKPCEVRLTINRKRTATGPTGPFNKLPEPLPVQLKRKNCPYVYKKDTGDSENVMQGPAVINENFEAGAYEPQPVDDLNNASQQVTANSGNDMLRNLARMYPNLPMSNLEALLKSAQDSRNINAANRPLEPQTIKCTKLAPDWSLKTSLSINIGLEDADDDFLAQIRKSSDSDAMARAVTMFIEKYSLSNNKVTEDRTLSLLLLSLRAASKMWSLSSSSLLSNGSVNRQTRISIDSVKANSSEQVSFFENFAKEFNAKWLSSLLSIFNMTKMGQCPYFYVIDDRITAFIGSATADAIGEVSQDNPFSKLVACIAPASSGILSWLRKAKINFASFNEHGVEMPSGAVIQDSEDGLEDEANSEDDEKGEAPDETDSLSYFEELGVASMILENLKAEGKAKERKRQPLARAVIIRGRAVLSFINLMVESRGFPDRTSSEIEAKRIVTKSDIASNSNRLPLPVLIAPVAFDCATLTSFRVRMSVNNPGSVSANNDSGARDSGSVAIQLNGTTPLPPFVIHRVLSCLVASKRTFTAAVETWQPKSQADHMNSALASVAINDNSEPFELVIDREGPPKTFSKGSFQDEVFVLPVSN